MSLDLCLLTVIFFCGFESHGIHHHEKPAKFEEHVFFNKSALIFVFCWCFFRIRSHGIHRHFAPPFVLQEYVWVTFFQPPSQQISVRGASPKTMSPQIPPWLAKKIPNHLSPVFVGNSQLTPQ